MPTYTYKCRDCEYQFDQRQSMADDPLTDCPNCGRPQLRKVINSAGIVFRGSGFYVTDNRNGTSGQAKETSEKTSSEPETKSKSGSESKTKSKTKSSEKAPAT